MNLAKNGAVLLAALSVFAMTSCGSKDSAMSYKNAVDWIKEHYGTDIKPREVKTSTCTWNYSNNKTQDKVTPNSWKNIYLADGKTTLDKKDINYLSGYTLTALFNVKDATKAAESKGSADVEGAPVTEIANVNLVANVFSQALFSFPSLKTYKEGDGLKLVAKDYSLDQFVGRSADEKDRAALGTLQDSTYHFDKNGYLTSVDYKFHSNNFMLEVNRGEDDTYEYCELGYLDLNISLTIKEVVTE